MQIINVYYNLKEGLFFIVLNLNNARIYFRNVIININHPKWAFLKWLSLDITNNIKTIKFSIQL